MSAHEKAVLTAATGKTANAGNLSDLSVAHDLQKCNKNIPKDGGEGGGDAAAPLYFAIDGEKLMEMELLPIEYVIDELLTPGVFIIAGGPKMGKSWMMLQFTMSISQQKPIWGYQTNGKGVLYLCLEDSYRRIRRRLDQMDEMATKNMCFLNTAPRIIDGLDAIIERNLWMYPDTSLVIIDTLQMVRGSASENCYSGDYEAVLFFKRLADKLGITILLVHHTRKSGDDNPFNTISGSTGLTGAADGIFVLVRDEDNPEQFKLSVTGRDIEQKVLTLEFDSDTYLWELLSCESGVITSDGKPPVVFFAVCEYVKTVGSFEGSASELLTVLGDSATPVNTLTKTLNKHKSLLLANNITYKRHRSNSKKTIELAYCA